MLRQHHTVTDDQTNCEQQPEFRISKASALFEEISITPAFQVTLVELAREGK